jgi:hypothetical protein
MGLMDLGALTDEEIKKLSFLINKIKSASGIFNGMSDIDIVKELMEKGTIENWQIKELNLFLGEIINSKKNNAEEKLFTVLNKIAESKEAETKETKLDPENFGSDFGM